MDINKRVKKRISEFRRTLHHTDGASSIIFLYTVFLSFSFLIATSAAVHFARDNELWRDLIAIYTSPSPLVTDYFALGGLASAFLNAAICGFFANLVIALSRVQCNATVFAAYLLVVAHCFYGLNLFNMLPPMLGVLVYSLVRRMPLAKNVHLALFATALGPFISEFSLRYPLTHPNGEGFTLSGVIVSVIFGIIAGFLIPALIPETAKMHRGYNMYKAGLAIGLFGIFAFAFMYKTLGVASPGAITPDNVEYYSMPYKHIVFVNAYLIILFAITLFWGFALNKYTFDGYSVLLRSTGYGIDFVDKFGMPLCLVNFALYGSLFLGFLNIVTLLPTFIPALPAGAGFTGATIGVVFAALTFSADGQQPRTVFPIILGYTALFLAVSLISISLGREIPWTLGTQGYINGIAFATGLCPFTGKFGFKYGVIAGFLSAVICTSTSAMHGGFVLYNGGFSAGLTALILVPILEFYNIQPKYSDDD